MTCFEEESCGGDPISTSTEYSANDCLWTCKAEPECNWFTFNVVDGTCAIFEECGENVKCSSCLSGERACGNRRGKCVDMWYLIDSVNVPYLDYTKLVVLGGRDGNTVYSSAEVIDTSSPSSNSCSMPDYPVAIEQQTASLLYRDTIKSCGGKFNEQRCFDFASFEGVWSLASDLKDAREFPSSSVVGDDVFLIAGGYTSTVSTEFWDGQQFVRGPSLPEPMYRACQVTLDYNRVFFMEGYSRNGYILDWETRRFTPISSMTISRQYPACGLVQNPDGAGPEVVVAGYGTSEIYNVNTG